MDPTVDQGGVFMNLLTRLLSPDAGQSGAPPADMSGGDVSKLLQFYQTLNALLGGHLSSNPFGPMHHYDYPALFRSGYGTPNDLSRLATSGHWPSEFKTADHPNRFIPIDEGGYWDTHNDQTTPEKK